MANTLQEAKIHNRCALAFLIPNAARLGVKIEAERDDYGLGYRLVDAKTGEGVIEGDDFGEGSASTLSIRLTSVASDTLQGEEKVSTKNIDKKCR